MSGVTISVKDSPLPNALDVYYSFLSNLVGSLNDAQKIL